MLCPGFGEIVIRYNKVGTDSSTENLGISVRVHVRSLQSFELERLSILALVRASAYQG